MLKNNFEVFPRNVWVPLDLLYILLSGETQDSERLAFSFGRFTEVDLELAKFYSVSRCEISVFSPEVLCWSKKFCIWKQIAFSKLKLLWPQNLTCLFSPLELQLPKQWPRYLFTFHKRWSFQTPQQGQFCLPGDIWQYLGAFLSATGWGGNDGNATGIWWGASSMLLNTAMWAQRPTVENYPTPSDSIAEAEKR